MLVISFVGIRIGLHNKSDTAAQAASTIVPIRYNGLPEYLNTRVIHDTVFVDKGIKNESYQIVVNGHKRKEEPALGELQAATVTREVPVFFIFMLRERMPDTLNGNTWIENTSDSVSLADDFEYFPSTDEADSSVEIDSTSVVY